VALAVSFNLNATLLHERNYLFLGALKKHAVSQKCQNQATVVNYSILLSAYTCALVYLQSGQEFRNQLLPKRQGEGSCEINYTEEKSRLWCSITAGATLLINYEFEARSQGLLFSLMMLNEMSSSSRRATFSYW
jgi:hypothetical protein